MLSMMKNAKPVVARKQDRVVAMVRKHREIQERVMTAYRKREIEFLKRLQAEMLRDDMEDEDLPCRVHG